MSIGQLETSRNGDVIAAQSPVMTTTTHPCERVLFDPGRDANPFFHFFECLWMMHGSDDGTWLDQFVSDFSTRYAEEDGRIWGAYGARWREWPNLYDQDGYLWPNIGDDSHFCQLETAVALLRKNPKDRRVVIGMWDPVRDLDQDMRDVPCNTHIYPRIVDGALELTVCCRSNDIIWGATGANAVHFSFLQEWMAAKIGVRVGRMHQLSNNWHAYTGTLEKVGKPQFSDPYTEGHVAPYPICTVPEAWDDDLAAFMDTSGPSQGGYKNSFFGMVALPMRDSHAKWRDGDRKEAVYLSQFIAATDWRLAVQQWMQRRIDRAK